MVGIDELERLRGALENIGNLSLDGCIKVNTPHGLWVGTPDAYAREVLGMPWRAPEGHQRMTDTEIRELRAENARLKRDKETLLQFAQAIKTWRSDANSYDRECGHTKRHYCEDVELMEKAAEYAMRRVVARAALGEPQ